jgi:hypothetical protein
VAENMMAKRIGFGTISLLLIIMGILWAFSFSGVCLGDNVLGYLGLKAWSNGTDGIHLTIYYSLVFYISAFIVTVKNKNDLGARVGKTLSLIIGAVLVFTVFGLAV